MDNKRLAKGMREQLIEEIANALSIVKSYDLPAACEKLGLASGDSSEASSSKRVYIRSRLQAMEDGELLRIATEVEHQHPNFTLCELVRRLTDCQTGPELSDLTRRAVLTELAGIDLFGELHLVKELSKLWPLSTMPGWHTTNSLEESVYQHCIRNDDWTNTELLDQVGAMTCSRTLFFLFLEAVVSPNARRGDEQKSLIQELNKHLKTDGYHLVMTGTVSGYPKFSVVCTAGGVLGAPKNLIFAADGPKPEIVLSDAINNDIRIVENEEFCLVYDRQIGSEGVTKFEMLEWWKDREKISDDVEARRSLVERMQRSLDSDGEKNLFRVYYRTFKQLGDKLPALIPQVYLHYDPYTARQLGGASRLPRQRMDFLILFSSAGRVVIEVDGEQHFSEGVKPAAKPSLKKYAEMMAADRDLRLAGYEVYRFGSNELVGNGADERIAEFFRRLLQKHGFS